MIPRCIFHGVLWILLLMFLISGCTFTTEKTSAMIDKEVVDLVD